MDPIEQENTEPQTIEIGGKQIQVSLNETTNTITIARPEGMSDADFEAMKNDISTGNKLAPIYYAKLNELNRRRAELDAETQKVKAEKLNKPADQGKGEEQEKIKPLWEELGLSSEDDLEDFAADNPSKFISAATEHAAKVAKAEARAAIAEVSTKTEQENRTVMLEQKIKAAGHDPDEVEAFARQNQMPFGEPAYEYYCMLHADKVNPIVEAQIKAQQAHINFVEPTHFRLKPSYTREEVNELPDDQLDAFIKHAKEVAGSR